MRVVGSIAGKLVAIVVGGLVVFLGLATWFNLLVQERATTEMVTLNGVQVADLVLGATRDGMLKNDREGLLATISTLSQQREIERIRILDKEGRIAHSSFPAEIGEVLDQREEQCMTCHGQANPPQSLSAAQMVRRVAHGDSEVLGITQVIRNEPACADAGCHVHPANQSLLGMLDINMQLDSYNRASRTSGVQMLIASLVGILLASVITAVTTQRMIHRPVREMTRAAEALAHADHSVRVPEVTRDELGLLAATFNRMARDLERAHSELLEWAQTLEQRVHQKTSELERAQQQILQVEKMASLGRLAAVVAHEINNPLASVVTYARILIRRIQNRGDRTADCQENQQYLESIASEASRCGEIVSQLLSFARQPGGEPVPVNLNTVVEKTLFLMKHKFDQSEVEAVPQLADDLDAVKADPLQVQQALMALLINACEALEGGGKVLIRTRREKGGAVVEVEDNGPGMSQEVAARAFEPFFTTKSSRPGTGLGLSVVYSIVKSHGGRIDLVTAPGSGSRFSIFLPGGGIGEHGGGAR